MSKWRLGESAGMSAWPQNPGSGSLRKETPLPLDGKEAPGGAWLAQFVEQLDLGVTSPTVGVEITLKKLKT